MLLHSGTHKNIGLAILSPGLPPRATADPDSRKQLVEADAIRAQQQALIEERRNQQSAKYGPPGLPATPATAKQSTRLPKTLSSSVRSTKRARAPPNITIEGSAGRSVPDLSIQSAPLYAPKSSLYTQKPNGDSGPMTSSLYHKDSSTFPYSIPHRRGPSDPTSINAHNSDYRSRPSPPRLPPISATLNSVPHPPPTPQTPTMKRPTELAKRWLEGKSIRPRRRAKSDQDLSSSEDSDTPITIHLNDKVTMTKMEWIQRGHDLLERAWHDMVLNEKNRQRAEAPAATQQLPPSTQQQQFQHAQNGPAS